ERRQVQSGIYLVPADTSSGLIFAIRLTFSMSWIARPTSRVAAAALGTRSATGLPRWMIVNRLPFCTSRSSAGSLVLASSTLISANIGFPSQHKTCHPGESRDPPIRVRGAAEVWPGLRRGDTQLTRDGAQPEIVSGY